MKNDEFLTFIKYPHFCKQSISYKDNSLITSQQIEPYQLLMQSKSSNILWTSNLPLVLKNNNQLDEEQKILVYLIILKMDQKQLLDDQVKKWLEAKTQGITSFPHDLILASCDTQLIIEYAALKNAISAQIQNIRDKITKIVKSGQLEQQTFIQRLSKIIEEQKKQQYQDAFRWALQFRNTRAFGYTRDTLIVPFFDYCNYDPSKMSNIRFVTYNNEAQLKIAITQIKEEKSSDEKIYQQQINMNQDDQDSEEEREQALIETKEYVGLISCRKIQKECELLLNYGNLGNRRLLLDYGYSIINNPHHTLHLYISKSIKDKMIHFSAVERPLYKIILRKNKISNKLIQIWRKVREQDPQKSIKTLIQNLQSNQPPQMKENDVKKYEEKKDEYFKWVKNYQQENVQVYKNQIDLLKNYYKAFRNEKN